MAFFFRLGASWRRGGVVAVEDYRGVSCLLEATSERAKALWEYWIPYRCTSQAKREALINLHET